MPLVPSYAKIAAPEPMVREHVARHGLVSSSSSIADQQYAARKQFIKWVRRNLPSLDVWEQGDVVHLQGAEPGRIKKRIFDVLAKLSKLTATPITTKVTGLDSISIDFTGTERDPMYGYAGGHTPMDPILAAEAAYGSDPRTVDGRTVDSRAFGGLFRRSAKQKAAAAGRRAARAGARKAAQEGRQTYWSERATAEKGTSSGVHGGRSYGPSGGGTGGGGTGVYHGMGYAEGHTPMDNILAAEESYGARGAIGNYSSLGDKVADEMFGGRKRRAARKARRAAIQAAKAKTVKDWKDELFGGLIDRTDFFDDSIDVDTLYGLDEDDIFGADDAEEAWVEEEEQFLEESYGALDSPSLFAEEAYGWRHYRPPPRRPYRPRVAAVRRYKRRHDYNPETGKWQPTEKALERRAGRRERISDWYERRGYTGRAKAWDARAAKAQTREAKLYGPDPMANPLAAYKARIAYGGNGDPRLSHAKKLSHKRRLVNRPGLTETRGIPWARARVRMEAEDTDEWWG
jgi:hypothetical protein